MFFTAIAIAIILRNNIPLGPVCLLLQHTAVAPVASAPRNWPPKPRLMILFPLPELQSSPESWPARAWLLRMTKRHVLPGPGTLWLPAKLTASSFKTTGKNHIGLRVRLQRTDEGVLAAWPTPPCPACPALLTGGA